MAHTKVTKTGTQNTGTANTFSYSGSFDVFKASEVEVELDNIALTFTTSTINESASPREYTVDYNAKTVHIGGANLASSNSVVIQPVTDMGAPTPRATYAPGASVTSDDLNNNQLQLMRKAMEYNEQKLSSRGGTMTGNLHLGQNVDLSFEGDNDNAHEITLTVADPTSDKTITFPDTTGTVVTTGDTGTVATGMIANDAINGDKIANDSINSEHYVDGSIDTAHIGNAQVVADKIADTAILSGKLANEAVITTKIADDAVTSAKLADNAVLTANITDANVTHVKLANDAVDGSNIQDSVINTEHYADGSIRTEHIAAGEINTTNIAANAVTTAKITDANVTADKIADTAILTGKLAANAVTTAKIADSNVTTDKIAGANVTDAKLASNSVITSKITDANVTTVKIADSNITLAKLASDLKQTSISDSDTQLPTSGAVVDYVAAQIAPLGGLEVVATDAAFPNVQPQAGVVISISDAGGVVFNGSGSSTTARTVGGSTVTINGAPSSLNNETLVAGVGLMVSSTGSSQTYNYHKILGKEDDIKQLSDDINDFNARYRVGSSNPSTALDSGDLFFNTGSGKLLVYNGTSSAWEEAQSIGQYFINTISSYSGTGGNSASFNGAAYRFVLSNPGTVAEQHIVSINGVIQKPNSGTSQPSEGFAIDGSSIIFSSAPATGADFFIITIGSTVNIGTPSDGTVSTSKLASGAVITAKIADDAVTTAKIADDAVTAAKLASDAVVTASIVDDAVTAAKIANSAVGTDQIATNSVNASMLTANAVTTAKITDGNVTKAKIENLINNNADNRVITGSGTANTLEGEANCTFNGDSLGLNSSSTTEINLQYSNNTRLKIHAGSNFAQLLTQNGVPLAFKTDAGTGGGTERMRIDSSGNIIIGTDSSYGSSLGQLRILNNAASTPASLSLFGFGNTTNGSTFAKIDFASQETGSAGQITAGLEAQAVGTDERAADLVFKTRPDTNGSSPVENLRIRSNRSHVRRGPSYANYVTSMKTVSSSTARDVQVLEDCYGQWLVVAKISSTDEFKGSMSSTDSLDTTNNQVTGDPSWSSLFGDTYPSEVRYISASDWNYWRDTRIIDFIHGVPDGRQYKEFFTNGNSSGMGIVADNKHGWKCAGCYDGFGRWRNPNFENHKMADTNAGSNAANNPIITSAFFTTSGQTMNWHNGNLDAKFIASHDQTTDGQDDEWTTGWGWDDNGLIRSDEFPSKGNNSSGTDLADYNLWICIKLGSPTFGHNA